MMDRALVPEAEEQRPLVPLSVLVVFVRDQDENWRQGSGRPGAGAGATAQKNTVTSLTLGKKMIQIFFL